MGIKKRTTKNPRKVAFMKLWKKSAEARPVFALKYDPSTAALQSRVGKILAECFKQWPLIAYTHQKT